MNYLDRYYKQLEGATILKYEGTVDYGSIKKSTTPSFLIQLADGEVLSISLSSSTDPFEGGTIFGLNIVE